MRGFAIVEGLLVASLAVALIAKPPSRQASAAPALPVMKLHISEKKTTAHGTARSFVRTVDGRPASIGVVASRGAIEDGIVLSLPPAAVVPPFTHIAIASSESAQPAFDFAAGTITLPKEMFSHAQLPRTIASPRQFPPGYFPATYTVTYDPASKECSVSLDGLAAH